MFCCARVVAQRAKLLPEFFALLVRQRLQRFEELADLLGVLEKFFVHALAVVQVAAVERLDGGGDLREVFRSVRAVLFRGIFGFGCGGWSLA